MIDSRVNYYISLKEIKRAMELIMAVRINRTKILYTKKLISHTRPTGFFPATQLTSNFFNFYIQRYASF